MVKDWGQEPLREEIERFYHTEDKPLKEVMRLIKGKYAFHASERSYRTQLLKWNLTKYSTESNPRTKHKPKATGNRARLSTTRIPNSSTSSGPPTQSNIGPSSFTQFPPLESQWFAPFGHTGITHPNNQYMPANIPTNEQQTTGHSGQDGEGRTQLHTAVIELFEEEVKALLFNGAAVDTEDHSGNQPLHYAVLAGDVSIVKELLRFGANPNAKSQLGRSPLHFATTSQEITEILLLNGATASAQDNNGDTPLHLILPLQLGLEGGTQDTNHDNSMAIITKLIGSGADVNIANNAGFTPFHRLAERTEYQRFTPELFQKFLQAGADVHLPFPDGHTPFHRFLVVTDGSWLNKSYYWHPSPENMVFKQFIERGADPLTLLPNSKPLALDVE